MRALYLHVPFCHSICPFCAFAVRGDRPGLHGGYLAALEAELALRARECGQASPVESVYVGGGTPSTLALPEMERLLAAARLAFPWGVEAEVAVELNPEDATVGYLRGLKDMGVTRVSLGSQSFDDATLALLGRAHRARHLRQALEALAQAGMANFNLDVMFGAPGMNPQTLLADVAQVVASGAAHVSLYALDVEAGSRYARDAAMGQRVAGAKDDQAGQYLAAAQALAQAGYRHYEVSNWCRPGFEGRQNLLVWGGAGYLGLGPGAHSYGAGGGAGPQRWRNPRNFFAWRDALLAGQDPALDRETLTPVMRAEERLMLALRQDTGLDGPGWARAYGQTWGPGREALARQLAATGRATYAQGHLRLTAQGFLLADEIATRLALAT